MPRAGFRTHAWGRGSTMKQMLKGYILRASVGQKKQTTKPSKAASPRSWAPSQGSPHTTTTTTPQPPPRTQSWELALYLGLTPSSA